MLLPGYLTLNPEVKIFNSDHFWIFKDASGENKLISVSKMKSGFMR